MERDTAILISILLAIPAIAAVYLSYSGKKKSENSAQVDPEKFTSFKLVRKEKVTHNTSLYRFALPNEAKPLGLPPGRHIQIRAFISSGDEPATEVIRNYTPVSLVDAIGHFDLLVKTYPTGKISKYLDTVPLGGLVEIRGPKGTFQYKSNMASHIGLIAGGTGITPVLQVARTMLEDPEDSTKISLIVANVSPSDILLEKELNEMKDSFSDRFSVTYLVNSGDEKWKGPTGLVTPELIKEHLPAPNTNCRILICGPPPMMNLVVGYLSDIGYPPVSVPSKPDDVVYRF